MEKDTIQTAGYQGVAKFGNGVFAVFGALEETGMLNGWLWFVEPQQEFGRRPEVLSDFIRL